MVSFRCTEYTLVSVHGAGALILSDANILYCFIVVFSKAQTCSLKAKPQQWGRPSYDYSKKVFGEMVVVCKLQSCWIVSEPSYLCSQVLELI